MQYLPLFIAYCIWLIPFAYINKLWIDRGFRVRHGINGAAHCIALYVMYDNYGIMPSVALLLAIRVIFDTALNRFRGLPVDYVTPTPKSLVDMAEQWAFGKDGLLPKILYSITSIGLLLCEYLIKV